MLGLRYFTMLCNNAEYKKMDQDMSLGQLYKIQNEIKILYKQRANSFPTTLLALTCKNLVRASTGAGSGGLAHKF